MAHTEQIEALNKYIKEATKELETANNSLSDNSFAAVTPVTVGRAIGP